LKLMRKAGAIVGNTLAMLSERVKPGVRTADLDEWARESLSRSGAVASFPEVIHPELGTPFPGAICTSVNDEIVHGIPSDRVLNEGDIVSIDLGAIYEGFHGDSAVTVAVGAVSAGAQKLLDGTREALRRGIERVGPERPLYDVSAAIDKYATSKGLGIVRQYVGHGIGRSMHEAPQIPNYHMHTPGPAMKPGWALAIEPMLNLGSEDTRVLPDRWTVATADGSLSAHFEHTVAVTARGHQIMTLPDESRPGDVR
jgi:methionyl aminopeptidase